jgi:4-amino-4-deoxy-L-arabinose transferase-like glycosyltransferase
VTSATEAPARWPLYGLALLLAICTAQNLWVVEQDSVPAAADESGYYRAALAWREAFATRDLQYARALLFHGDPRPPLVPLLTGGLFALSGQGSIQLARHALLPFLWVAIIATFALGTRLGHRRSTGLMAASLLAAYPQVLGFSRLYWMDLPLAGMTALCVFLMLWTEDLQRPGRCVLLGVGLGLGLLVKYSFAVFMIGPLGYALVRAWRIHPWRALARAGLLVLCAGGIAGLWYGPTLGAAWFNFVYNQGTGALGPRPWWTLTNLITYARCLPTDQIGWVPLCALLLSLPPFWRGAAGARAILVLWSVVPYLFFTYALLGITWSRFTLPYLPALAIITAVGLTRLRGDGVRWGCWALSIASLGVALVSPHGSATSSPTPFVWERAITRGLTTPRSSDFYLQVAQLPPGTRFAAVFPDYGTLSSVLSGFSAEQGSRLLFVAVGAPPSLASFPRQLSAYSVVVRVLAPGETPTLRFLPELHEVERQWRQSYPRFRLIAERRIANGYRLLIYYRRA